MKELLEYFKGDELAANVWLGKYAQEGDITPDDMHKRMAKEFARIEDKYVKTEKEIDWSNLSEYGKNRERLTYESIYNLFKNFKYIVPQGSIMSNLGNKSVTSLSNCLGGKTKVLTRDGFIPIYLLKDKEVEVMTLGGGWVKAPFKSYGVQKLYKLGLSKGKTNKKEILCTIEHAWYVHKKHKSPVRTPLSELKVGDKLHSQFGKGRNGYVLSSIGIAHGIAYGDGHTVKGENNCNNITLCSDSRVLGKYFPDSYVSSDENLCEGGSDYYTGLPNYFRELPSIRENKSYLYGFLAGWFAADGNIDERGSLAIHSVNINDIKFLQNICGVLGIGCGEIQQQTVISNLTNRPHTMYKAFLHSNHLSEDFFLLEKHKNRFKLTDKSMNKWKVDFITEYGKSEEVFCAEVPNTYSFVIEGNILSGNCFVIGQPSDSYGGICKKDEEMAQLMKRRGGVGLDVSTLRPSKTLVSNAAKSSTGMVSFMPRYSNTTREVAQDGRRGALMLSTHINHPDVMDFITIKRDLSQVTGANISIKLNDKFMEAVENNEDYLLRFPCNIYNENDKSNRLLPTLEYNILTQIPESQSNGIAYVKKIKAKEYWNEIIKSAHSSAEPGIIFEDNHHNYSPDGVYPQFKGITTNPCGEIFMQEYDACRLIAVNFFSFVENPFTDEATFNYEKFYQINYEAMRLSDDLIDLELEHIDRILRKIMEDSESFENKRTEFELWTKIKETATASRRTGLGFTALGDALAALGLKYDSDEAMKVIAEVMKTKMRAELDCTIDMSILRGSFEGWDNTLEYPYPYGKNTNGNTFYAMLFEEFPIETERMIKFGRRNVSWSTVAPTGTVSILTQTSSGIEPLFMPFYIRRKKVNPGEDVRVDFIDQNGDKWQEFPVLHPKFKDWYYFNPIFQYQREKGNILGLKKDIDIRGYDEYVLKDSSGYIYRTSDIIPMEELTKEELNISFKLSPYYKSIANDIDWVKRVEIQGIIQKYITHSISSTINLPNNVTEAEVSKIYMESWKKGLKGITVYRDGSRSGVLITESTKDNKQTFEYKDSLKRPRELDGDVHHITVKGTAYKVIVGLLHDKPYEIFIDESENKINGRGLILKKSRGNYFFKKDDITTDITSNMTDEQAAITRLTSTALRHGANIKFIVEQLLKCEGDLFSFTKSLARVLKKYIPEGEKSTVSCQDCGSNDVIFEEGCQKCRTCGSSKCG